MSPCLCHIEGAGFDGRRRGRQLEFMIWWTMACTSGPLVFSSDAKRATIRRFLRVSSLLVRSASSASMASRKISEGFFSGVVVVLTGLVSADGEAESGATVFCRGGAWTLFGGFFGESPVAPTRARRLTLALNPPFDRSRSMPTICSPS